MVESSGHMQGVGRPKNGASNDLEAVFALVICRVTIHCYNAL